MTIEKAIVPSDTQKLREQKLREQKLKEQQLKIQKLSNSALETNFASLVRQEREILPMVILHIFEIENRKLYLERNCASLFQYLVQVMKYSAPSAQRRIEAMRLLKSVPRNWLRKWKRAPSTSRKWS